MTSVDRRFLEGDNVACRVLGMHVAMMDFERVRMQNKGGLSWRPGSRGSLNAAKPYLVSPENTACNQSDPAFAVNVHRLATFGLEFNSLIKWVSSSAMR